MKKYIKRTLGTFIVPSVFVIAALAVAIYQNNKTTTSPTKTELQSSLDNAVEWLYINQQSIMRDHNSALWWMLKEAADISDSHRLKVFYQQYKSNFLDKRPDNVWTPYFKPHYKPYVPPDITEKLHDYQILFIYGLSCDKYLGEEPVILESLGFSTRSDSENIQSIKVLSFGNEFCEVMAVRVNQEKFRKGIA